jgi:hypothetical protein
VGQMLRLAKPLRVDRKVREVVSSPLLARGVSGVGNLLLARRGRRARRDESLAISVHRGECDAEFSALAHAMHGGDSICTQRSAAYLNWRYVSNPLVHYEILTARREGVLLACAVFTHSAEDAILVDLCGVDAAVIASLLDSVVDLLRQRGVMTVSAPMFATHPWVPLLQQVGFRVRETRPMVVYVPAHSAVQRSRFEETPWFCMHGDRDS